MEAEKFRRDRQQLVEEFHRHVGQVVGLHLADRRVALASASTKDPKALADAEAAKLRAIDEGLVACAGALKTMSGQALALWKSSEDWRVFRAHLIMEEAAEVLVELARRDAQKLTKELVDLEYVTKGTAVTFGLPMEDAFDVVHASNMTKDAGAVNDRSGKKGKGPNYVPADLSKLFGK